MPDTNGFKFQFESDPAWIAPSAYIADNATIVGEVHVGDDASILHGAVVRGDSVAVWIGKGTNVQDLAVLHGDPGYPCRLGDRVTVGHGAIVHGAEVEDDCLIGIRAIVLNGAKIGKHSIIGAGSLVAEGKTIPPRSLVLGVPVEWCVKSPMKISHASNTRPRITSR